MNVRLPEPIPWYRLYRGPLLLLVAIVGAFAVARGKVVAAHQNLNAGTPPSVAGETP